MPSSKTNHSAGGALFISKLNSSHHCLFQYHFQMLQVEVTIKSDCECRRESTTNCTNPNCETIPLCTYENRISDEMVCAGAKGKGGTKVYVFFLASRAAPYLYCQFINSPLIIQSDRRGKARTYCQITSSQVPRPTC